jgi:hypothetical protein
MNSDANIMFMMIEISYFPVISSHSMNKINPQDFGIVNSVIHLTCCHKMLVLEKL